VLKARDLVIEELVCECQKETGEVSKDSSSKKEGAIVRTTNNWFGDNEFIPLKYLVQPDTISSSVEETLKNNPFCSHLSEEQLKNLISNSSTVCFDPGTIICAEGEKADKVYIILEGKVKVYKTDESGEETEIATIEKGNMFGEMALFDKGVRSASVKSIDLCKFLIIKGDTFLDLTLG